MVWQFVARKSINGYEFESLQYGDFSILQYGGRRHLGFWNFKFLTVGTVRSFEMRNRAKFRQNRSNHGWNMATFLFLKMAAAAILDFKNFKFLTVGAVKRVELRHHAKFR